MKAYFYCLVLIAGACGTIGCATLLSRQPSARTAADQLELIKLGVSYEEFTKHFRAFVTSYPVKYRIHAHLAVNPFGPDAKDFTIYRQWPSGVLLNVMESDVELEVDVVDSRDLKGGVFVYFDAFNEYRGYFVYSTARYSKDETTRLHQELSDYKQLGFEAEQVRAKQSMALITAGGGARDRLPKLPLSKNKASNVP